MANSDLLTKNQTLVLGVLEKAKEPVSAYSILERLRDHGFRAPLQVYRALDKLLEMGKIHRLESLNAFVACAHVDDHGHGHNHGATIFAICENCGKVTEFHDDVITGRLADWEKSERFKPEKTTIEIRGFCADCMGAEKRASAHSH